MSVRTHKRFAAFVAALILIIAAHPARSATYSESGSPTKSTVGTGSFGMTTMGDADKVQGCPPPAGTVSKTSAGTSVVAVSSGTQSWTFGEWLARWMTGLLQRIGYGY
jgi:hypothetical protein